MTHSLFPNDFLWGAATAAYQVEGAACADGKGPSIWDVFCATPGKTAGGDTGAVACDHYHRWRDDLKLMQELGLRAYRFSISWPRIQPQGRGPVNEVGLDFYDRLVDALKSAGIEPVVTLYHWDLPAALQMELGGWVSDDLPVIFADYSDVVYRRLADRVRFWVTINEPWVAAVAGHLTGAHAPGIRSEQLAYRAGHNMLRAHAHAVARYRAGRHPRGAITLALNTIYGFPATDSPADAAAAERAVLQFCGWFGDPAHFGDYAPGLRERLGPLLPEFSAQDRRLLAGSMDYIALNYYFSEVIRHLPEAGRLEIEAVPQTGREHTAMGWPVVPEGLERLLLWLHERYNGPPIYVTENGAAFEDQPDATGFVNDPERIAYLRSHLEAAARARRAGIDLRGYFVWSLLDNLEWSEGFRKRFGIVRCDFDTLRRTIKASGRWFADVIRRGALPEKVGEEG